MRPKRGTVSASSLATWEECPQKFAATQIDFTSDVGSSAPADTGTTCHYALEHFVEDVCINKIATWDKIGLLIAYYDEGYAKTFGTADKSTAEYKDGLALVKAWHKRTDLSDVQVLTVEQKLRTPVGVDDMLLTYIFDRCDYYEKDGRKILRVVDYKSVRARWTFEEIENKVQSRLYALAAMIQYKDWDLDEVWVVMDLLRHDGPVGVVFSREDCVETYEYLQETVQTILNTDRANAPYRLGPGCRFCPIKLTCPAMQSNANAGGILQLTDIDDIVTKRAELDGQRKGIDTLVDQLDAAILEHAKRTDASEWESETGLHVKVSAKGYRGITDMEAAAKLLGPDTVARIGKINIGEIDKLIKNDVLDEETKAGIRQLIGKNYGKPGVAVSDSPPVGRKKK